MVCELDLGCRPLAGHPVHLLGKHWEGVRVMLGAVPATPGSDRRGYKVKHICNYGETYKVYIDLQPEMKDFVKYIQS